MAIKTLALDVPFDVTSPKTKISQICAKNPHGSSRRLVKVNFTANDESACSSKRRKNSESHSPYLMGDTIHSVTVERFFEKTLVHKKGPDYSSFPFGANLYKANSDEFKIQKKKANKKVKKSVLTLPNNPAPLPQLCTVSDLNDSDNSLKKFKKKPANIRNKASPVAMLKKNRGKSKEFGFYDRDTQYCAELNIDLDCSSTEIIKGKGVGKKVISTARKSVNNNNVNLSNVWAVLRNINKFQFRSSPPMSEDSFEAPVKMKGKKRNHNSRKDVRLVESTRAEEFAYISRVDVKRKSGVTPISQSSSNDKITVIDTNNGRTNDVVKQGFDKKLKPPNALKIPCNRVPIQNNKLNKRNNDITVSRKLNNLNRITPFNNRNMPPKNLLCKNVYDNVESTSCSTFGQSFDNTYYCNGDKTPVNNSNVREPEPIEFIYSTTSGSSKALNIENNKKLSAGRYSPKYSVKPRPGRIPPGGNTRQSQQLHINEIKQKLARLKFPIVVLGRDELRSSFNVVNQQFSQFNGLEEAVWPFMVQWQENENRERHGINNSTKNRPHIGLHGYRNTDKSNNELTINRESLNKEKSEMEPKVFIRSRTPQKRITPPEELDNQIVHQKPKQIRQLKDRMLKLLYKSSSSQSSISEKKAGIERFTKRKNNRNSVGTKDVGTDPCMNKDPLREQIVSTIRIDKLANGKKLWAKGRWASDFIDNVIKKIKTGVYYSLDNKGTTNYVTGLREVEVQTIAIDDITSSKPATTKPLSTVSLIQPKPKLLFVIPGFEEDNILTQVEISSIDMKEISVKHCDTNIMVRFDVTMPTEPILKSAPSNRLIPLSPADSHTKVFKCNTNIINAILPEELCSVLPSILSNINKSTESSVLESRLNVEKLGLNLSPQSEIVGLNNPEILNKSVPLIDVSNELSALLDGTYSTSAALCSKVTIMEPPRFIYGHILLMDLLPILQRSHFFDCDVHPITFPMLIIKPAQHLPLSPLPSEQTECTALEPYPLSKRSLIPGFKRFDLAGILENVSRLAFVNWLRVQRGPWFDALLKNGIKFIQLTAQCTNGFHNSIIFDVCKFANTVTGPNSNSGTEITIHNNVSDFTRPRLLKIKNEESKRKQNQASVLNNKIKRKKFVDLYRKSKSTSSISVDRTAIPLSSISNLDDFFLALGSGKSLASVFNQVGGRKILSSLVEMKTWISEINPKQALLVLLLNNKKDTPNLVRYRPVILQGIATNRITQANELDMEIEVIERENMNKITHCEGISYLPASAENKDSLYEELCWIAKTTASDYQTTFDASSEQLLKSLLQKRKKLSPSYLRVMARYVGLGLLRAPNQK